MKTSDRELILAYLAGNEKAFAEFYDKHAQALYVYLLSCVHGRENAEELLQETFLALLDHLGRIEIREDMRPFLFTTARNRAVDWLRRERRRRRALTRIDCFLRAPDPGSRAAVAGGADPEELNSLLHRLPDAQREVVVLKVVSGLTFREISELVGASENTVVSRYRYAIDKLRSRLLQGETRGTQY